MSHQVDFDSFTENYNALLHEETKFFTSNETYFAEYKVNITRSIVTGEPKRILEYGCGIGRNLSFLQSQFKSAKIFGSDVSAKSLDIARIENPGMYFWEEGDEACEQSGFDLIFVAGVFHHIPPQERVENARKLYSRLNDGGSLVIFEHNPYNPLTRRIVSYCPYDEDAVLLTPRELRQHLVTAGLYVIKHAFALFFPPSFKVSGHFENKFGWLPLGGQYWVHAIKK